MDNVTHAFVGAAIGECAVPAGAAPRTRIALLSLGVVAANAPDVDLVYTNIIQAPLGYLLHHRGHSHTLPGLVVIGLLIWAVCRLVPPLRPAIEGAGRRPILLIAVALASHVLMDTANSYGTHLLYPLSSGWIYGDAVFVLEPWCWALLGTALALNAGRGGRIVVALLTLALIVAVTAIGLLPLVMLAVMLVSVTVIALAARAWDRRPRAAAALAAIAIIFVTMPAVSRAAKEDARVLAGVDRNQVVDILADANPGVPWCWSVLVVQKADDGPKTLIARRATVSLVPRIWPAASCASARLVGGGAGPSPAPAIVWHRRWDIDVDGLRALAAGDCHARAWLQFGRVPFVENGRLRDLRFENVARQNFTAMTLGHGPAGCPGYLTAWEPPWADVLAPN